MTDDQVIALARNAKNADKFKKLWAGDIGSFYETSEADIALCGTLAFYSGGDAEQVERVFARSELGQGDRWKNSKAYRDKTIDRAIRGCDKFYQSEPRPVLDGVLELADRDRRLSAWRAQFNLARRLRSVSVDKPEQFEAEVMAYCKRAQRGFDEFWWSFLETWGFVKTSESDAPLAVAKRMNEQFPWTPPRDLKGHYNAIAGVAYYLNKLTDGGLIQLPGRNLGEMFGVSKMTISKVLKLLVRDGVIKLVRMGSHVSGLASDYEFVCS